jgi:hypothetical protein
VKFFSRNEQTPDSLSELSASTCTNMMAASLAREPSQSAARLDLIDAIHSADF